MKDSKFDPEEIKAFDHYDPRGSDHLDVEQGVRKTNPCRNGGDEQILDRAVNSSRVVPQRDQFGTVAIPS